jgi:hypothetical protein
MSIKKSAGYENPNAWAVGAAATRALNRVQTVVGGKLIRPAELRLSCI